MTERHVFYRNVIKRYPMAAHGEGVWIYDSEGKAYLDGSSGALVASIGHGRREVAEAASRAIGDLGFAHSSQFTTAAQESLAARLAALAPAGLEYVYPVSGGSEANETAIKMAHQYHVRRGNRRKRLIVSRAPSYHGNTLGALSASGHRSRRAASAELLMDWPRVEAPPCETCRYVPSCASCGEAWADAIERAIVDAGPNNVAAFIAESVTGSSCAAYVTPAPFFERVRAVCDRYDVLFIADEVMSGIGRTGYHFAIEHGGVTPDLITAAKGVSGGYAPLGAVIVSDRIFRVFSESGTFVHGFTHGGSPISAAVGATVLEIYEREGLRERARERGAYLRRRLEALSGDHPIIGEVRGLGLMLGLELVENRELARHFPPEAGVTGRLVDAAFEAGLILYPAGVGAGPRHHDQVLIGPPLVIAHHEIDRLVELLDQALTSVERAYGMA
ncbi:MAG TPA: aminotransferase class III-fold pyridoxal phosphate-dependent enzyme [Candidatus Dormibacteraeota bacterium]|nr:aminotransferase class III-fold pyridoxal phosphate-dependent enzyme [Candidatus Dormibacteraeota bacterium]